MNENILDIALTGSRKSGKHGVSKLFKQLGAPIFDADTILKYLLNYKPNIVDSVQRHFGKEYVFNGFINPLAFNSDDKFNELLNIVEFELFESYSRFKEKTAKTQSGYQYTIFLSSFIFERNWIKKFDKIISVFSPKEDRMYRYKVENFDTISGVHNLFANEMNDFKKNQMSDFIIHNYPSAPDILNQVQKIDDKLVETYLLTKSHPPVDYDYKQHINNILTF